MDLYAATQPYLFALVLLLWVTLSFTSTRAFLFMTGMLTPLMVPRMDIGVNIDWCRVLGPLALGLVMLRGRKGTAGIPPGLGPFIGYATGVSVIWMVIEYAVLRRYTGAQAMGLSIMQAYYKMPVQLGSFLGQVLIFFVVPMRATTRVEAMSAVRGYAFGALTSFAFGILLYLVTGQGMLARRGAGMLEVEGIGLSRIGGLSGEPKVLGMAVGVLAIWELSGLAFKGGRRLVFGLALLALISTFSTSAWAGVVVGAATVLVVSIRNPLKTRWSTWISVGAVAIPLILTLSIVGAIIGQRFTGRLFGDKSEVARQKDAFVFEAFKADPMHVIWGFGLGGGDLAVIPYVPPEELAFQRTPTPGVTGARLLGDLGVLGVAILIATAWRWSKELARRGYLQGAAFAIGGLFAVFFGSLIAISAYFLIMGAVLAAVRLPPTAPLAVPAAAGRRARLASPLPQRA